MVFLRSFGCSFSDDRSDTSLSLLCAGVSLAEPNFSIASLFRMFLNETLIGLVRFFTLAKKMHDRHIGAQRRPLGKVCDFFSNDFRGATLERGDWSSFALSVAPSAVAPASQPCPFFARLFSPCMFL